jgi:hypothetical protein
MRERQKDLKRYSECPHLAASRRRGPSRNGTPHWVKVKNPKAPAVKREAEEDWGR